MSIQNICFMENYIKHPLIITKYFTVIVESFEDVDLYMYMCSSVYEGHPINSGIFLIINLCLEFRYQEYNF